MSKKQYRAPQKPQPIVLKQVKFFRTSASAEEIFENVVAISSQAGMLTVEFIDGSARVFAPGAWEELVIERMSVPTPVADEPPLDPPSTTLETIGL